ncbi:hypothetical protein [uncultured Sphingomonas sp.]|uniref:hypothetical protein n=1 Tax=uncultured Sphingomonas sp. TaxID=158754 RepID=UPI0035CA0643
MAGRTTQAIILAASVLLVGPMFVPEALAFPFHARVGGASVWSETTIPPAIVGVLARADALVRASPIDGPVTGRRIFLTDGGWRWQWLAIGVSGAMGLTRSFSEAVIVNRSDVSTDRVTNGPGAANTRTLSGVIAHERTHGLIRARYGLVAERMMPMWLREGYPDYVARESSLSSESDVAALRRTDPTAPALAYHDARRRVAAALAANGGSVDRLFAEAHR